jgi:hypothetical protein
MATKNAKAKKASSGNGTAKAEKRAAATHIAVSGSKKTFCGARGKIAPAEQATCASCKRIAAYAKAKEAEEAAAASAYPGTAAAAPAMPANEADAANCAMEPAAKPHKANTPATKSSADPAKERDPRIPEVGTVIRKLDRHGSTRCQCEVVEGGFEYKGELFKSLSGAACAAAKDLGIHGQVNGFVFWGIVKEPRAKNPVQAIERVWDRYSARVKAIAGAGLDAGSKKQVAKLLEEHRTKIAEASGAFEEAE